MAYTKTTWRTDDVITAEKLNNAEQGIAQNAHDIEDLSEAIEGVEERVTENTDEIDQLKSELTHKVAQPLDEYNQPTDGTDGQLLRTKGDGSTEWSDVGLPTDAQTAQAVSDWLDDHPEATTTVQDGAITNKKLADGIADSYYNNINYASYRKYHTDIYYAVIPVYDSDGEIINPFFYFSQNKTPNEIAQELKTDVTFNGAVNYKKTDDSWQVGNVISRGTPIYNGNITGTLICNDAGYFSIGRDRTFRTFPIETTQQELLNADAYNVSEYYFRLITNGQVNDFTQVIDNDGNVVDGFRNPYIAIGATASKELVILACNGRTEVQAGLTPSEMADELLSLGVVDAVSLDGGGSASLSFKSVKANKNDDGGGTIDRMIRFTFNVKKPNVNDFIAEPFAEIGKQKQAIRAELYPYINDLYGKTGIILSNGVTVISEGADLNDFTEVGRYRAASSAIATSLQNCPTLAPFTMTITVINADSGGSFQHYYVIEDNNGDLYTRRDHYYSNAHHFTSWKKIDLYSRNVISRNTDLNAIDSVGNYYGISNNIVASFANCPTSVAFVMHVDAFFDDSELHYTLRDLNGDIFVRINHIYSNANHFTPWVCITSGQAITVTKNATYVTNDAIEAKYSNGLLSICGNFKVSSAVPGNTRLFTFSGVKLTAGRPCILIGSDNAVVGRLEVTGDGVALFSYTGVTYSYVIYINATFPATIS